MSAPHDISVVIPELTDEAVDAIAELLLHATEQAEAGRAAR